MDTGEGEKFEKRNDDPVNYQSSLSSDWRFGTANFTSAAMGLAPAVNLVASSPCSSATMVSSFGQAPWDQASNSQNLGYSGINVQHNASSSDSLGIRKTGPGTFASGIDRALDMGWNPPSSMLKGGLFLPNGPGMLPQSLTQFPADSGFIERAARFSCFSSGNFNDMVNPFGIPGSVGLYSRSGGMMQGPHDAFTGSGLKSISGLQGQQNEVNAGDTSRDVALPVEHGATEGHPHRNEAGKRPRDEATGGAGGSRNESEEAQSSGNAGQDDRSVLECAGRDSSMKGSGSKKRKKNEQDAEVGRGKESPQKSGEATKDANENQPKGDQNPVSSSNKTGGKHGKQGPQGSDPPKEEYIHVRARRGQATNSHSLAERVRREKISERMKFLQDLVPGCSKVTGKAVMLDEIINYVQSLQRQVEFLSMKLATVNPRLDFNLEGLLAKDILQARAGPSSMSGFSPEMSMAYPLGHHPTQPGLIQAGLHGMGSSSDLFRRTMNPQMTPVTGGFKETTQIPHVWEDELHNVIQMGFGTSAPPSGPEENGSLPPGNVKAEQ